jgi:hypothetical protein
VKRIGLCPRVHATTRPGRKVLIRADGAGATREFLTWVSSQRLSYSVGFTLPNSFAQLAALRGQVEPGTGAPGYTCLGFPDPRGLFASMRRDR